MKFIPVIIISALVLFSCGEEKTEQTAAEENLYEIDSSEIETSPIDNPDQSFLMRYKMELNKNYKYRIASISNNNQTVQLDTTISQNVNQKMIYIINVKPTEMDQDSVYDVVCTFNSIKLDAIANGQQHSYESGVTKDSADLTKFANNEALINNSFNLRVDNKGDIVEIYKTDKIISRYLELQNLKDTISADERNVLREQISQGAIKPLLSQIFRKLPGEVIAKDSSWTISQPPFPFLVFQLQNNYLYKINSLEELDDDKVAVINATMDSKITGNPNVTEQGITYEFKKPTSVASGTIYFNVEEGFVIKSTINSKTTISFTMEGNTPTGKQKGSRSEVTEFTNIVELL
ncbi:MAG: hypothetical protein EHM47_07175 [Ignavibacteriales bacterium]|nr:MAG: hypothetical protein EHM47_07175 [Ignavibacteriales bacterium]